MKRLIFLLILFPVFCFAQEDGIAGLLGKPTDSIIYEQNLAIKYNKISDVSLISAKSAPEGGLTLVYQNITGDKIDYDVYYFDDKNKLIGFSTIFSKNEEKARLKSMLADYDIIDPHLLYHKKYNLKVTHNVEGDRVIFVYKRRQPE
jgi:hypothetical protein